MRNRLIVGLLCFIGVMFMGCNGVMHNNVKNDDVKRVISKHTDNETEIEKEEIEEVDEIAEKIKNMSLDEKIGQLFIVGFDGTSPSAELEQLIKDKHVGGVIFFSKNVESVDQVLDLTNEIKGLNKDNKNPIIISVDEEGGSVSRMPEEFFKIPSNERIGKKDDEKLCYDVGDVIGEQLQSLGFNMDFAPVLDIYSNPKNTVIGNRAFGGNSDIVSKLGISTMKGIESRGIVPVVKHFPGHGDTDVDSHVGLPIVTKDLESLENFELIPFKKAIENNVDVIMVSHIILSQVDSELPATLSQKVVNNILRDQLGFDKVVVTDDMTMGAIVENYTLEDATVKSINAGVDLVLVCFGYENQINSINAVKEAVENGSISEARIDESVYRILSLKHKYNLTDEILENHINTEEINNKTTEITSKVNN